MFHNYSSFHVRTKGERFEIDFFLDVVWNDGMDVYRSLVFSPFRK